MKKLLYIAGMQEGLFTNCKISDEIVKNIESTIIEYMGSDCRVCYGLDITGCGDSSDEVLLGNIGKLLKIKFELDNPKELWEVGAYGDCYEYYDNLVSDELDNPKELWEVGACGDCYEYYDNLVSDELHSTVEGRFFESITIVGARLECEILATVLEMLIHAKDAKIVVDLSCVAWGSDDLAKATVSILKSLGVDVINNFTKSVDNQEDFCDWVEDDDNKIMTSPHDKVWYSASIKDFKYCPYCSKKIRIIK